MVLDLVKAKHIFIPFSEVLALKIKEVAGLKMFVNYFLCANFRLLVNTFWGPSTLKSEILESGSYNNLAQHGQFFRSKYHSTLLHITDHRLFCSRGKNH